MLTNFGNFLVALFFLGFCAFVSGQKLTGTTAIRSGTEVYRWDAAGQDSLPANWLLKEETWNLHDGILTGKIRGQDRLLFPIDGRDVALEVQIAIVKAGSHTRWVGIVGRWQPEPESYASFSNRFARTASNGLEIACYNKIPGAASYWEITNSRSWQDNLANEAPRKLRLELVGSLARCFVDDKLTLESLLPENLQRHGKMGIVINTVEVAVTSVRIETLPPLSAEEQDMVRKATIGHPLVIAHRGDSAEYPENTIPAILSALEQGADAVEVDLRLSKDGVPYLFHDQHLERVTEGKGNPAKLTMAELKKLTVTQRTTGRKANICTLEEAVEAIKQQNGILHIDLKEKKAVPAMIDILQKYQYAAKTIIGCGRDFELIKTFRETLPEAQIVIITGSRYFSDQELAALRAAGVNGISIRNTYPQKLSFRQAKLHGMTIYNWTINNPAIALRAWQQGVDAIVTDKPKLILKTLQENPLVIQPREMPSVDVNND